MMLTLVNSPFTALSPLVRRVENGNAEEEMQRTSGPIAAAVACVDMARTSTLGEVHIGERSPALKDEGLRRREIGRPGRLQREFK